VTRFAPLLALAAAACAVPGEAPQLTPKTAPDLGLAGPAAPAIAPDWWREYGDPQLDRVVADALAGAPSLEQALARVRQAQAQVGARRAEDGPDVSLDAQAQVARLSGRYTIPPPYRGTVRFVGQGLANLNWNLDLFGRQAAAIAGARASARAAALDAEAARLALAGSVVQAYLELVRAERLAAIARGTIAAREQTVSLVDVRIRNRLASNLDREAATTLLAQARQALVRADGARVLATQALAALAGRGPDYAAGIAATGIDLSRQPALPAVLPADLLARRADVAAALARIDAAAAGRQVARRAFYPNVNLAALAGLQAIGVGNLLSLDAGTVGAGPAVSLPIFDNGRRRAELAGATAAVDLAVADYDARVVGAAREAADALARIRSLEADRRAQAAVVRGFAETGRLNAIRVASGLESRLGVLDNDIRLLAARQDAADLDVDAAVARAQLVLALGGGFQPRDLQP
jgi:NodT family efflux transporter outer membrane factor (OMF) lipoprotein